MNDRGGLKYIVKTKIGKQDDWIFFKLAIDSKGLYGSDELAMKSASHELKVSDRNSI